VLFILTKNKKKSQKAFLYYKIFKCSKNYFESVFVLKNTIIKIYLSAKVLPIYLIALSFMGKKT